MTNELKIFFITLCCGMFIGIAFDIFRIMRKNVKHCDWLVNIQDSVFCILTAIYVFYLTYWLNDGQFRLYILVGIVISNILYFFTISKYVILFGIWVFRPVKMLFSKIGQKKV